MGSAGKLLWRTLFVCGLLLATPLPGHAGHETPSLAACSASLTLALRPGLTEPNNQVSLRAAPDIPSGPVLIRVPLYPGAVASRLPMSHADYSYPASRYLKSATAEYELSTGWNAASSWYRRAFAACGYTEAGLGSSELRGQIVSIGITMGERKQPPLDVAIAFTHGPAGKTLVLYVAYTITLPPPAIMVPGSPSAVTILAYRRLVHGQPAASSPNKVVVVRDGKSMAKLIRHLNHLPRPQGAMFCPLDNGSHDELLFAYPDGHQRRVDVGLSGCRTVRSGRKTALALSDTALFSLLDRLLNRAWHRARSPHARPAPG